jgi:hypothetical protein
MAGSIMTWNGNPSRLGRFDYERDWIAHHLSAPRGQNEIAQGRVKRRPGFPYSVVDK